MERDADRLIRSELGGAAKISLLLMAALSLSACNNAIDRLSNIGEMPKLSAVENPALKPGYQPVSMPMPTPDAETREPNSLWQPGARAFFRDERAARVGDILTVTVDVSDQAVLSNETDRQRTDSDQGSATGLFGYENKLDKILPKGVNPANLLDTSSTSQADGKGTITRNETIATRVAATITQVLPNGNLVIKGSQEVSVNFELRELTVEGIVRPEDISAITNTIDYSQIAEARISYGGRGQETDVQQPRYGQQLMDIIFPF